MAATMSGIADSEQERLTALLEAAGLPTVPPKAGSERLKEAMQLDKKVKANQLRLILLRSLGDAFVTADYSDEALHEVLQSADA